VAEEKKHKLPAFHPPLFAAFPILSIYSANVAIIPIADLWRPLFVAMAFSCVIWGICSAPFLLLKQPRPASFSRGAAAASVIGGTAVLYAPVTETLKFLQPTWIWLALVLIVAALAARFLANPYWPNLLAAFLVISGAGGIAYGEVRASLDVKKIAYENTAGTLTLSGRPPDIFYIILDGYGREDMLRRVMNFDNSDFTGQLRKRGFYVADRSHSNYVQTEISLSSSLNFNFIPKLVPHIPEDVSDRTPFDALISNNAVARFLRDRGYRTIAVTSGFPPIKFPWSDLWIAGVSSTSLFETTLLQMSPFVDQDTETESQFIWRRAALLGALQNVRNLADESVRPRFVFVHILAPHPPFVFGPKGESVPHHGPFGYWDGSDFTNYVGPPSEYRDGYVAQTTYLNGEVLKTLDALLASKQRPIILVQGDHGSKMHLDQNVLAKTDVTECFENLSAYYVPDEVQAKLYPTITPVNSFRIILSTLFGAKLPNLPDRSWYSPFGTPFHFTDVTKQVVNSP
jgi:hypothetical protein